MRVMVRVAPSERKEDDIKKCYRKMCQLLIKGHRARWKSPENIERWMEIRKRRSYVGCKPSEKTLEASRANNKRKSEIAKLNIPDNKAILELSASVIRFHRIEKGITQDRIAGLLGLKRSRYDSYEKGYMVFTLRRLVVVCSILGISINHFMLRPKGTDLNVRMRVLQKAGAVQKRVSGTRKRERSAAEEANKNRRRSEAHFETSEDHARSSLKDVGL